MTRFSKCYPFWNFICLGFHLISGEIVLRANPDYIMSFKPLTLNCSTDAVPNDELVTLYVNTVRFARIKYFTSSTKCFIERFKNGQSIGGSECNYECDCQQGTSYIWTYNGTVNTNPMTFTCIGGFSSGAVNDSVVVYQAGVHLILRANLDYIMSFKPLTLNCSTDVVPSDEVVTFYVNTVRFARIKYFTSSTKCFIERFVNDQSIGGGECNDECDCQQGTSFIWSYNGTVNTNPMTFICIGGFPSGAVNDSVVVYQAVPVTSVTILPSDDTNITNIVEGKTMMFTCTTDYSLPAALIHWYIGGKNVTNLAQPQAPQSDQLKYISSSIFVYTGEIADHNKDIFCEAVDKEGSYKVTSQKKYIYVQIGPTGIHLSPVNYLYIVTETKSINRVICAAICRPSCNYTWTGPNGFTEINAYLQLNSVYRNQTGLYICHAKNEFGSKTSNHINIIVKYAPTILRLEALDNNIVGEHQSVTFECAVESYPAPVIKWIFPRTNTMLNKDDNVFKSNYTITKTECLQTGPYRCQATNVIDAVFTNAFSETNLFVLCSVCKDQRFFQPTADIAIMENDELNITVFLLAYPKPLISWTLRNFETGLIYAVTFNNSFNIYEHSSTVYSSKISKTGYGVYTINAYNDIGLQYIQSFSVIEQGHPHKPTDILVACEIKAMIVSWRPGFNGGTNQTFRVVWKNVKTQLTESSFEIMDTSQGQNKQYIIRSLDPETMYIIYVVATNKHGIVKSSQYANCSTGSSIYNSQSNNGMIMSVGAGVGSSIFVLLVAGLVIFFLKRRNYNTDDTSKLYQSTHLATRRHKTNDEQHSYNELQTIKPDSNQENVQTNSSFTYEEIGNIKDEGNYQNVSKDKKVSD